MANPTLTTRGSLSCCDPPERASKLPDLGPSETGLSREDQKVWNRLAAQTGHNSFHSDIARESPSVIKGMIIEKYTTLEKWAPDVPQTPRDTV